MVIGGNENYRKIILNDKEHVITTISESNTNDHFYKM